jgi:hypothetical protein
MGKAWGGVKTEGEKGVLEIDNAQQSARGLAQSKTLSRVMERGTFRQILDCGSPL